MGKIGFPETNYQYVLLKSPEERSSHYSVVEA
jgi:hypothetical protein